MLWVKHHRVDMKKTDKLRWTELDSYIYHFMSHIQMQRFTCFNLERTSMFSVCPLNKKHVRISSFLNVVVEVEEFDMEVDFVCEKRCSRNMTSFECDTVLLFPLVLGGCLAKLSCV